MGTRLTARLTWLTDLPPAVWVTLGYTVSYIPYAYLIRGAGQAGELAVLPVYSASCALTVAGAVGSARAAGVLPEWLSPRSPAFWRAAASGLSGAVIMYSASWAYMNRAPPVVKTILMKLGTLFVAAAVDLGLRALDRYRGRRGFGWPPVGALVLAAASVVVSWLSGGFGPLTMTLAALLPALLYVVGWTGKMAAGDATKRGTTSARLSFLLCTQTFSAFFALVAGGAVALASGTAPAWGSASAWAAGFFSQMSGCLGALLAVLPATHAACKAASQGGSLLASGLAQWAREGLGRWEALAGLISLVATVESVRAASQATSAETFPGTTPASSPAATAGV